MQFVSEFGRFLWQEGFWATVLDGGNKPKFAMAVPHADGLLGSTMPPWFPLRWVASSRDSGTLIEDFSQIRINRKLKDYLPIIRIVEPRLTDLDLATLAGSSDIYGDVGLERLVPIAFMGEGLRRLVAIVLSIATCPGGVVLIDEIENGLHHSVMGKIWLAIGEVAKAVNCQVFATTHSYECIQAAQRAFADNGEDDLTLIRLERVGDSIEPIVISEESLETAIGHNWEIR